MTQKSLPQLLGRIAILMGSTILLVLMMTVEIHLLWWVLAGIPTALALLFYAVGRESKLDPWVAELRAGPIGRVLRIVLGVLIFYLLFAVYNAPFSYVAFWGFLVAPLVFLLFVGILELFGLMTRISQTKEWALGSVILVLGLYIVGPGQMKAAIVGFGGASLIVSGLFGYAGCELAALPNLLLRKHYVMGCVFFSPLDKLEQKWRTWRQKNREDSNESGK